MLAKAETFGPVEQARAWVRWYYEEQPSTAGSVMEVFSGKGRTQGESLKPSKSSAGFSPTRVHATETKNPKYNRVPLSTGYSGGGIRRAINALPGIHKNWVNYCYNPSRANKLEHGDLYRRRLWDLFLSEYNQSGLNVKTRTVIALMFNMQVGRAECYTGYCQWSYKRPVEFSKAIDRKMWERTYQPHWRSIRILMDRVDQEALKKVYSGGC